MGQCMRNQVGPQPCDWSLGCDEGSEGNSSQSHNCHATLLSWVSISLSADRDLPSLVRSEQMGMFLGASPACRVH